MCSCSRCPSCVPPPVCRLWRCSAAGGVGPLRGQGRWRGCVAVPRRRRRGLSSSCSQPSRWLSGSRPPSRSLAPSLPLNDAAADLLTSAPARLRSLLLAVSHPSHAESIAKLPQRLPALPNPLHMTAGVPPACQRTARFGGGAGREAGKRRARTHARTHRGREEGGASACLRICGL